jgi:hypothetical protein
VLVSLQRQNTRLDYQALLLRKIVPINFKINGWYFGNVLIGGLIGNAKLLIPQRVQCGELLIQLLMKPCERTIISTRQIHH